MKYKNIYKEFIFFSLLMIFVIANNANFYKFFTQSENLTNSYKDAGYYFFYLIITVFVIYIKISKQKEVNISFKSNNLFFAVSFLGLLSYFLLFNKTYTFKTNFWIIISINLIFFYLTKFVYEKLDKKIIYLSNFSIIFSIYIFHPYSNFYKNQINYFPPALNGLYGNLENDFTANITDPYPFFNYLIKVTWSVFDINSIFILNIFAISLFIWSVNILTIYLFKENVSGILFYLFPLILSKYLVDLYQFIPGLNRFSLDQIRKLFTFGISTNRPFSDIFEPVVFDILFLPVLVLLLKNKISKSLLLSALILQFHFGLLVPTGFIILWILFIKKVSIKKLKIPLVIFLSSLLLMVFFSETRLGSDKATSELADTILTNKIISVHRMVSPAFTFGIYNGDTPAIEIHKEKIGNFSEHVSLFNDETHGTKKSNVSFEVDRIIFYLFAIFLIKNKTIKYFFYYSLSLSIIFMIFNILFPNNHISLLVRDVVPWRITTFLSIISTIVIIGKFFQFLFENSLIGKISLFILMASIPIQFFIYQIDSRDTSFDFYKGEYHELPKLDKNLISFKNSKFLIPPDNINFSLHNEGLAATETRYHPYNKDEIVNWYRRLEKITTTYQGESCDSLIKLGKELGVDVIYLPKNGIYYNDYIWNCEYKNLLEFEDYKLIIMKN